MTAPKTFKLLEAPDLKRTFIFVGTSSGYLAVGEVKNDEGHIGSAVLLHKDGIFDIDRNDRKSDCFQRCFSLSTISRDGNLVNCFIKIDGGEIRILQMHETPMTNGGLEAFLHFPPHSRYICGFEKSFWQLFNRQTGAMISKCKVFCNGKPNLWIFSKSKSSNFLFYQHRGSIVVHTIPIPGQDKIFRFSPNLGAHGREITCLKVIAIAKRALELVATGSENGVLELSLYKRSSVKRSVKVYRNLRIPFAVKCLSWLQDPGQRSSVQKLTDGSQYLRDTMYLTIAGSREIFLIFRVTLDRRAESDFSSNIDVGVVEWSSISQRTSEESEVRIMQLDRLHLHGATWLIAVSQSDGHIRLWMFDVEQKRYQFLSQHRTGFCVFSIRILRLNILNMEEILILAGLADGTVRVFALSAIDPLIIQNEQFRRKCTMAKLATLACHQSGVRCLQSYSQGSSNELIIITGGDDNSLALQRLNWSRDGSGALVLTGRQVTKKACAHASCINDVTLLDENPLKKPLSCVEGQMLFATVSSDQRLKIWSTNSILNQDSKIEISLIKMIYTDVADCTSMDVILHGNNGQLEPSGQDLHKPYGNSLRLCAYLAGVGFQRAFLSVPLAGVKSC